MKQAELNKLLSTQLRKSAKAHHWKYSRGFVFKSTDLLFFSINISAQVKRGHLWYSFRYKLLAFDDLFWKIVKMEENSKQPLSFRASGAWTAPKATISEGRLLVGDWETNLQAQVNEIIDCCDVEATKISNEICGLDDNLQVIERLFARLKDEYPDAVTNIWLERLLTSILKNEHDHSETIIQDRLNHGDHGSFQVGPKSFYDLANDYLHALNGKDLL